MILGPVSLVDCLVFCLLLALQLVWHVGPVSIVFVALQALPFLVLQLPLELLRNRFWLPSSSFVWESTVFEDIVVRCVRYAFKKIPPSIGTVFFSRRVALPFLRWRMLRHGYLRWPVYWREHSVGEGISTAKGVWIRHMPEEPPDCLLRSWRRLCAGVFCYFYIEFLLAWHHLLLDAGHRNPAIFALDYTLVPDARYPTQVLEMLQGYEHVLQETRDASRVCVAGDSAGATLVLSLLLKLASSRETNGAKVGVRGTGLEPWPPSLATPRIAALISPWVTLKSNLHYPSKVDYLDRQTLWRYAHEYAGQSISQQPASPGVCVDDKLWRAASPQRGFVVVFGDEEVLGPDIEDFASRRAREGIETEALRFDGGVHAWPVASMFVSSTADRRLQGLRSVVQQISKRTGQEVGTNKQALEIFRLDQVDSHGPAT